MVVKVARASDGVGDGAQVVAEQDHVGGDDGHVGARAQGQAELGGGQGGSVVDTVPDHGSRTASGLQIRDHPGLGHGQRLAEDLVDPGGGHVDQVAR